LLLDDVDWLLPLEIENRRERKRKREIGRGEREVVIRKSDG